jgi:uncharacterized membrane protein YfcA
MMLEPLQYLLGAGSGVLVGFILGLIGGGGSVLAVPLMVYLVGVPSPHVAIGTSAFAVAASAVLNLANHARAGNVNWRCAGMFAAVGVIGTEGASCTRRKAPKVLGYGLMTGVFSGFFGIGGGFLIVPGLIASTGMPMLNAIGSSLVAVTAFGLTTALNYASSGLVDWPLAFIFIAGGVGGGLIGTMTAKRLSGTTGTLSVIFAGVVFAVAGYMLWRSTGAI